MKQFFPPFRIKAENKMIRHLADHFFYKKNVPPDGRDTYVSFRNTILAQVALQQFAA
jgi:hypothetical protein